MYIEIKNNKIYRWARNEQEGFIFLEADFDTFSQDKYIIQEGGIVDVSQTRDYIKAQRLKQIDIELVQVGIDYSTAMDTAVIYPVNGKSYKPNYAGDNYSWFFQAENISKAINPDSTIFPVLIKDSTKLNENGENMSIAELTQLTAFLAQICDSLWTEKSDKEDALLTEKATLMG